MGFSVLRLRYLSFFSQRVRRREPVATIGVRRERADVKKGTPRTKPVRFQLCFLDHTVYLLFLYILLSHTSSTRLSGMLIGYGYTILCTTVYVTCKIEQPMIEAILVAILLCIDLHPILMPSVLL